MRGRRASSSAFNYLVAWPASFPATEAATSKARLPSQLCYFRELSVWFGKGRRAGVEHKKSDGDWSCATKLCRGTESREDRTDSQSYQSRLEANRAIGRGNKPWGRDGRVRSIVGSSIQPRQRGVLTRTPTRVLVNVPRDYHKIEGKVKENRRG